ncbi:hypothetical protein ACFE04_025596 [Oxalis oulophora]
MGDNKNRQVFDLSIDLGPVGSKCYDDDGRLKRTGTVWTASAHIITAVIGSGVLSLAWATAQLGWVAGPTVMFLFSFVTYYTSTLLAACYRSGDPITGKRNYTYMDAVRSNLGGFKVKICGWVQYLNLFGVAVGYTIASAVSMMAINRAGCFHSHGGEHGNDKCEVNSNPYMIAFGVIQIIFSQIPNFDQLWWLSALAAVMSFTYSSIGLGLGIAKVVENGKFMGRCKPFNMSVFRMVWRTLFVILTTVISMLLPFFNDVVGLLGALGFWPLTVYFPVEMYIAQKKIPKWSTRWICLQILSMACLVITIAAAIGSIAGVVIDLKTYKPFSMSS